MPSDNNAEVTKRWRALFAGFVVVIMAVVLPLPALPDEPYAGRPIIEILQELRAAGAPVVFSTDLVRPGMVAIDEPTSQPPIEIAREILTPHGLQLQFRDGSYLVVRGGPSRPEAKIAAIGTEGQIDDSRPAELETLTVSTSRYLLQSASHFFVDQRAIQALPDLGEDPLRAAHRLPGTAASGLSSRSHFRGGEHDETVIYLNGLQLLDPFHIRDYHSIFSSIDARAISGVEAYTGGFPAQFGDHMSGVLSLESRKPEDPRHTELGLSFYSTSILHSGFSEDGRWDWLVSGRDSNLDVVLSDDLGSPDYFDIFAQLGRQVSDRTHVSFNALYADDSVVVITEDLPEELERSDSETRNEHFWLRMETDWTRDLSSVSVLSSSSLDNLRVAVMNDPDQMIASALDSRTADVSGFSQEWRWSGWPDHYLRFGVEYRKQRARYHYRGAAEYVGFLSNLPDLEDRQYVIDTAPRGHSASLFLSDRWRLADDTWLQYGLRWDSQTWPQTDFDDQLSPRASLLYSFNDTTDIRLSAGRYYQSQAIHRLQVEDGVDQYSRPQRSDHLIAGLRKRFPKGFRLRAELFLKRYARLKSRFENLFDPLALIPELAPDRVRLDPSSAESRGVELSLEYDNGGETDWWLSYVYSRATDRISGVNQPRSWDQRHAVQAGISWEQGPWALGAAINAHTGWPTTPLTAIYDPEEDEFLPFPGPRNSERFDTFFTLDFRVSREFDVRKGSLSAFLEVSNATNRKNSCCVDWDVDDEVEPAMVDRSLDYWVPIIPAVGILWEF